MAANFLGRPNAAINKTLPFENYIDLRVTAVFEDLPPNNSEHFEFLNDWDHLVEREPWVKDWNNKGHLKLVPASGWFRKGLIVFQFALSIRSIRYDHFFKAGRLYTN